MNNEVLILVTEMSEEFEDEFSTIWGIPLKREEPKPEIRYISKDEIKREYVSGTELVLVRGHEYDLNDHITPRVIEVCKTIKGENPDVMIEIGIHAGGGTERASELKKKLNSQWKETKEVIRGVYDYSMHPVPEKFKPLINYVKELVEKTEKEENDRFSEAIKNAIDWLSKKKDLIKDFSRLKHRIAHCFLSIDLDLQGLYESKESEYLKDILSTKQEGYYTNKLNQARCYTVGGNWCNCAVQWGKEHNQSFQQPDNSILNLLEDSCPKEWSIICTLLGLSESNYSEEIESSPIAKFFKNLEENRGKGSIGKGDVDDILNYFTKHNSPSGWHVPDANPSYIKSFHDWCCALDDALDRLRASLLSSNRVKGD